MYSLTKEGRHRSAGVDTDGRQTSPEGTEFPTGLRIASASNAEIAEIVELRRQLAEARSKLRKLEPYNWINMPAPMFQAFMEDARKAIPRAVKAEKKLEEVEKKMDEYDEFIDIYAKNDRVLTQALGQYEEKIAELEKTVSPDIIIDDKRHPPTFSTRFFQSFAAQMMGEKQREGP
jgi:hypothetical protein